jgi:hypothetical protein
VQEHHRFLTHTEEHHLLGREERNHMSYIQKEAVINKMI